MSKIILTIGISGSGKTTKARFLTSMDKTFVRCNRDDIRKSLFGYTDEDLSEYYTEKGLNRKEEIVTLVADGIIKAAIRHRKNVIVDNTHLKLKYLEAYKKFNVPIEYRLLDIPTDVCIVRDRDRDASVGESVIKRQAKQLKELKQIFDFDSVWYPENYTGNHTKIDERIGWDKDWNVDLPNGIIVDLDGTLALMNGRSPFDGQLCETDVVNYAVEAVLNNFSGDIILLSGRNSDNGGRDATTTWLAKNNIPFTDLYMRKEGDTRKDTIVKKEMYEKYVKDKINVIFVLDDRDMMVEMWRNELNLNCLQVHWGNF